MDSNKRLLKKSFFWFNRLTTSENLSMTSTNPSFTLRLAKGVLGLLHEPHDQRGFSLVEVMIALFIFSIGALSVVSMIDTSLRSTGFSRAMSGANHAVQRGMEEIKSMTFTVAVQKICDGSTSGFGPSWVPAVSCVNPLVYQWNGKNVTDVNVKYRSSDTGLSNLTYDLTMQMVEDYPVTDVDMITVKAQWSDRNGIHKTIALTYMEN